LQFTLIIKIKLVLSKKRFDGVKATVTLQRNN